MTTLQLLFAMAGLAATFVLYLWDRNKKDKERENERQENLLKFITETKMKFLAIEKEIAQINCAVKDNKDEAKNDTKILSDHLETVRKENRDDHNKIFDKLDIKR